MMSTRSPVTEAPPAGGFAARATAGVLWTTAQKWVGRLSGLATIALLTRLLSPEQFGVVAIGMAIVPFVYLLADFGFAAYLVQADDPTPRSYSTAFWYSTGAGLLLAGGLWAAGPVVEVVLGADGAAGVVSGLAPAVVAVALGSVPLAILRRRMAFRTLAVQGLGAGVAGQAVAIGLALAGAGAVALVAQTVATQVVVTVGACASARWLPRAVFSRREFVAMLRYGAGVVGVEVVALGRLWAENAIVAVHLGVAGLGYLSIAQRLIQVAQDVASTSISPVSTVVFAQIRAQGDRLAAAYARAQSIVYVVVIPVMVLIVAGGEPLVTLVFGPQWAPSALPAQALAIAGVLTVGAALDLGLFHGLGRPGTWLLYAIAVDALTVGVTLVAAPHGLAAVAIGFVAVALAATVIRWPLVAARLGVRWWTLALPFARAMLIGALVAGAGLGAAALVAGLPTVVGLVVVGATVALAALGAARLVLPDTVRDVARLARRLRRPS
jgi:O-antigen/teichoic acid export membrane protein